MDTIRLGSGHAGERCAAHLPLLFLNHYEVKDSVLWYVAQCLVYAGSIFGVTMYIHSKWGEVKNYIDEYVQPKAKKDEKD